MENKEIILPSGEKLQITISSFEIVSELHDAVLTCLKGGQFNMEDMKKDVGVLKDYAINLLTSKEVRNLVFKCGERALYRNCKFTKDIMDDVKIGQAARKDFYDIAWEIIRFNLEPFFVSIFSKLAPYIKEATENPQSSLNVVEP